MFASLVGITWIFNHKGSFAGARSRRAKQWTLVTTGLLFGSFSIQPRSSHACYEPPATSEDLANLVCEGPPESMDGGWWTGSNVVGGSCGCTFDFGSISQTSEESELSIPEYWGNCDQASVCLREGWMSWMGCCAHTWYEQDNRTPATVPQKPWQSPNVAVADCPAASGNWSTGECIEFKVRENGEATLPSDQGYLADGIGPYITQFIYLPSPRIEDPSLYGQPGRPIWNGGWKISMDTMCYMGDGEFQGDEEPCNDSEGGLRGFGNGPLQLEIYCGRPVIPGPSLPLASFNVTPYQSLQRFEAEFFVAPEPAPNGCAAEDGTYMISLVLRTVNDRDLLHDEVVSTSSSPNDRWRHVQVANMKMNPVVVYDNMLEMGLRDYYELYDMRLSQPSNTELHPVAGYVESCNGLLYRTSDPLEPSESTPEPVCGTSGVDPWAQSLRAPALDGSMERTGDRQPALAETEAALPSRREEPRPGTVPDSVPTWSRTRFAPLWHPWRAADYRAFPDVYLFVPIRPDQVFPWTMPVYDDGISFDDGTLLWPRPGLRRTRKWIAVYNGMNEDIAEPAFHTDADLSSDAGPFPEDWRLFEIIYMPVRLPRQNATQTEDFDRHRTGAYQIRGLLVRECKPDAAGTRVCEMPVPAKTSRAYILELPPGEDMLSFEARFTLNSPGWEELSSVDFLIEPVTGQRQDEGGAFEPEMPLVIQWTPGPLSSDPTQEEFEAYWHFVTRHDVTHLYQSTDAFMTAQLVNYRTLADDFPLPEDNVSMFLRLGRLSGLAAYTEIAFPGVPLTISVAVKNADGDVCSGHHGEDGKRYPCPYDGGAVAAIQRPSDSAYDAAWNDLAVGDYLACVEDSDSYFARIGETNRAIGGIEHLLLDVPFPSGHCNSSTTLFYRVEFHGEMDRDILASCGESAPFIAQSRLCSPSDDRCKPIACQEPDVILDRENVIIEVNDPNPSNSFITLGCDGELGLNQPGEFRCWLNPDRSDAQKSQMNSFIRAKILTWYQDGSLGPEPLVNFTAYDETPLFSSVSGGFDGFGQGEFPALMRLLQTQCDTPEGLIPSCDYGPPANHSSGTFPPRAANSVSKEFLYYFNRSAAVLDTDRDQLLDGEDPFPYCSDHDESTCNQTRPLFKASLEGAASRYARETMATLIPMHTDEFKYDANYTWAFWEPIAVRMLGHMWRKVADENNFPYLHDWDMGSTTALDGTVQLDLSLPNLILYPGRLEDTYDVGGTYAGQVGTWDTLPLRASFPDDSDRYLPVFLTDAYGRYGQVNGETWDFSIETVPLFSIPDQLNDAYMGAITEDDLTDWGMALPYGPHYVIRNGSLAQGVCYAEGFTTASGLSELGKWSVSYRSVAEACGDITPE